MRSSMPVAYFSEYPTTGNSSFHIEFLEEPIVLPGGNAIIATTQLEKLLGNVIGFIFTSLDWSQNTLPNQLIGIFDKSPKLERKRTRILQHTPILERKKSITNNSAKHLGGRDEDDDRPPVELLGTRRVRLRVRVSPGIQQDSPEKPLDPLHRGAGL